MAEQRIIRDMEIGSTIRKLRNERNMTQEQVISKLQLLNINITRSIYSQIEGGTYNIRVSVLAGLTQIFQVDYNTLFRDVDISSLISKEED